MKRQISLISNVEAKRRHSGLTQEELAGRVDVTRQTIIAIEKGNYVPSVLLALRLAKAFDVKLEEIFYEA